MCGAKQKGARKSPQVRILKLGCKRPGEISRISVRMKEARSVSLRVMLPKMKTHCQVIT